MAGAVAVHAFSFVLADDHVAESGAGTEEEDSVSVACVVAAIEDCAGGNLDHFAVGLGGGGLGETTGVAQASKRRRKHDREGK
ncbi:hypothetical protein ACMFMF_008055 [Clarireedia jacksonii]